MATLKYKNGNEWIEVPFISTADANVTSRISTLESQITPMLHENITYYDTDNGGFTLNSSAITSGNIFCNVTGNIAVVVFNGIVLTSALANNGTVTLATISDAVKTRIGHTYLWSIIEVDGTGKATPVLWNTWEDGNTISLSNKTGASIAASSALHGSIILVTT